MNPALGLCGIVLAACVTSTDTGSSTLVVTGTWDYLASQTSPTTASLAGTLFVSSQSRGVFQGSASVSENDGGTITPLSGTITGQTVNDTTVDFDIFFDANGRRHVAAVVRDTMRGSWVEAGGASTFAGSFTAVRRSGP